MFFCSWRGEHDARIAAEAKIKADEQQVQVLQRNIAQNNQAIAQLQEQQNARDAAATKQIATLSTLVPGTST
jgi:septal ring factor EnvC (AmiA/AmiB activator)